MSCVSRSIFLRDKSGLRERVAGPGDRQDERFVEGLAGAVTGEVGYCFEGEVLRGVEGWVMTNGLICLRRFPRDEILA